VITDPPYSKRVHDANRDDRPKDFLSLQYSHWDAGNVDDCIGFFADKNRGWWVFFSDHVLARDWEASLEGQGLNVFAPIPQVTSNRSVRLQGDGPSCWATWITVARPRGKEWIGWGALPGAYVDHVGMRKKGVVRGAKQEHTMSAVVRDYSRKGDLICDPCAGGGTTLLAAAQEGRRAIGAEIDPETFELAVKRLERGYTPDMFAGLT